MGTTKLTRKEILAEDPVHEALVQIVEIFRTNGKRIALVAAIAVLAILGGYFGLRYLNSRQVEAQEKLAKAIGFFHGSVAPDATADPYGKGTTPTFKSDAEKFKAAATEFSSLASGYGNRKVAIVARYYLGLSQLQLGQDKEGIQNLESVANNSTQRTIGFLAKKVLAKHYLDTGNHGGARELLEGMIKDPQCDLPKEDLTVQLSRVLVAQGKRDEAVKVLKDASAQGPEFSPLKQRLVTELDRLQKAPKTGSQP